MVVVVGRATPFASNEVPHVMPRAVPLSFILMRSFWKLVGVPERLVVNEVISAANAVMLCASTLSVFMVGVADDVSELTRGVILLFVRVFVEEILGIVTPSTDMTPAETRAIVVSEA